MYGYHERHGELREIAERVALIASLRLSIREQEAEIASLVANARQGANSWANYHVPSWADIAHALGVSKQAARQRYGALTADANEAEGHRYIRGDGLSGCKLCGRPRAQH